MPTYPTIAIAGAGPAGLVLANYLHHAGCVFQIFEGDRAADGRDQGGTLDLHPDDGQLALRRIGLLDEFLAIARHDDQEQWVYDFTSGALLHAEVPEEGEGDRPEIDRLVLRELLLKRLPPTSIRWGTCVERVVAMPDGRYEVHGADGMLGVFDLVVGADGAWSAVRRALSDQTPTYTGVTFVELWFNDVDRRHPAISRLVGRGMMFAMAEGRGLIAQRNGNASVRVYAAFNTTAEEGERPDRTLAGIGLNALSQRMDGCAPALLSLISEADTVAAVRPIVALQSSLAWTHKAGLTLIGDAAHVMPPLGVGVNLAMLDAAELGEALVSSAHWQEAVRAFEERMIQRATPISRQCIEGFAEWFGVDAASRQLEHFASAEPAK